MIPALAVVCAREPKFFETHQGSQGSSVHDYSATGLQIRPRGARQVEHQVHFLTTIAVPLVICDVFEPVEVSHGGVVKQHVDSAKSAHRKID